MVLNTFISPPYLNAAERVAEEFNLRGFSTDDPSKTEELVNRISQIIKETMEGNLVVKVDQPRDIFDEMEIQWCDPEMEDELRRLYGDGGDGALQNQIT